MARPPGSDRAGRTRRRRVLPLQRGDRLGLPVPRGRLDAPLLPGHGFGLWLRLAAATLVLLLPGRAVARVLGSRSWAASFAWSVALVAGALALTFAVHASLTLTLVLVLVAGAVAAAFRTATAATRFQPGRGRSFLRDRGQGAAALV